MIPRVTCSQCQICSLVALRPLRVLHFAHVDKLKGSAQLGNFEYPSATYQVALVHLQIPLVSNLHRQFLD